MHCPPPPAARPGPGSLTWLLAGERLALLAWPRAILLQLAHPLVAAGVGAHSSFRRSLVAPYTRLHATVRAMRRLTFGTDQEAAATLARILDIHDRVHGTLGEDAGAWARGTPYSAHDAPLVLWVHATLLDSHVRVMGELLGRAFSGAERDSYCQETAPFAEALGARAADVPRAWAALERYMSDEVASGRIHVSRQARELAVAALRPSLGRVVWPVQYACEILTVGSLPDDIRAQYGFPWDARRARQRARLVGLIRGVRRRLPDWLARWPEAQPPRTPRG
ncbi:MAG: oxygenase MpaB family protein [Acidobacteriota bacterium]